VQPDADWGQERAEGPPRGLVVALAVGAVLAALTLALGYFEGGMEGVCWGNSAFYSKHLSEAGGWRAEGSLWPPGQSCVALARDGSVLARETYPQGRDWLLTLALFALPCGVWAAWRRYRRSP
jgi:hypothetical protein